MNLGAENRTKVLIAVALGVIAAAILISRFMGYFGGASSNAAVPATVSNPAAPTQAPNRGSGRVHGGKPAAASPLDPTLRLDLLRSSEDTKYEGAGRNIFRVFVEIPRVVKSPVQAPVVQQGPQQPPPPPPINLKFYGFATPSGGSKRIFLVQGEDVFIAKEGDIVDRRYKVVRITANSVEILDVLSNNRQSIPLTQG